MNQRLTKSVAQVSLRLLFLLSVGAGVCIPEFARSQETTSQALSRSIESSVLRGQVSGQDEQGNYTGVVANAIIELMQEDGTAVGQAITDENGFYEISDLTSGSFFYKVKAPGFDADEGGRGFVLPEVIDGFHFDFVLTRGSTAPTRTGVLSGKVTREGTRGNLPVASAKITAKQASGSYYESAVTEADGSYSLELPAGEWQVSASHIGWDPQVSPGSITVGGTRDAKLDFVFTDSLLTVAPRADKVYALVSAPAESSEGSLEVRFVEPNTGESKPGAVTEVTQAELETRGLAQFFTDDDPVAWFEAVATDPLPAGIYLAEAEKEGLPIARSEEKFIRGGQDTWYDITLVSPASQDDVPDLEPVMPGIRGTISGQSELGDFLGDLEGATIELVADSGERSATATTDEYGAYEILDLGAGIWRYKVIHPEFSPADTGQGFALQEGSGVQVHDVILSRVNPEPDPIGTIRGRVWRGEGNSKSPIPNALIAMKPAEGKTLTKVRTDESGVFEVQVAPSQWSVSVMSDQFESQVYESPVPIEAGGEANLEFTFGEGSGPVIKKVKRVSAIVSVEQQEGEGSSGIPMVQFVSAEGETWPADVRRLQGHDLAVIGGDSGASATGVLWYQAKPAPEEGGENNRRSKAGLPEGTWRAEGSLADYVSDESEMKTVSSASSTFFDLALTLDVPPPPPPPPPPPSGLTRLMGTVGGQTDKGDYEGVLKGAQIDLFSSAGSLVGSAISDGAGNYEIDGLNPGEYTYRIARDPYDPDDAGRGFELPSGNEGYAYDFILTRMVPDPGEGELWGHVWVNNGEMKVPAGNAQIAVRNQTTGEVTPARTDEEGYYELFLAEGPWTAGATAEGFGNRNHPGVIPIGDGTASRVDFVFEMELPPEQTAMLSGTVTVIEDNEEFFEPGAQVVAINQSTGDLLAAVTDEEGNYAFSVPASDWALSATIEDLGNQAHDGLVTLPAGGTQNVNFVFEVEMDEPGEIFGQVWLGEENGEEKFPLANTLIAVRDSYGSIEEVMTDEEGRYSLLLWADDYEIAASSEELEASHLHPEVIALESGEQEQVDFNFVDMPMYLSDVYLVVAVERTAVETGDDPMVELFRIPAQGEEFIPIELMMESLGTNPETSEFYQEFGLTADDKMAGEWQYYLAAPAEGGVEPGLYVARGGLDRYVPVELEPRSAHEGLATIFDLPLERVRPEILVNVQCTEGNPVSDANITFVNSSVGQPIEEAPRESTNEQGLVSLVLERGFGNYNLVVNAEGFQSHIQQVSVEEAETSATIELFFLPEVNITVNDSEGAPLQDVSLKFINRTLGQGFEDASEASTSERGFASVVLEEGFGDYALTASKPGYQGHAQELQVDQEDMSLTLRLFAEGEMKIIELTGTVVEKPDSQQVDFSMKQVGNAQIAFQASPGATLPTTLSRPLRTNESGEFSAKEVTEGIYNVAVAAEGYHVYTGTLNVSFGMEPAVLSLSPRNMDRDNWIRMILTEGWGNQSARQFHQNGVREDPQDCKVDYAFGLSSLRGTDQNNALTAYNQAVGKIHEEKWWDRACEGYIWSLMYYNEAPRAASEIRRLISSSYGTRAATPESQETATLFGVAVGVLKGPWSTEATRPGYEQLDQVAMATLQEPLRSAYMAGRDGVTREFTNLTQEVDDAKRRAREKAMADWRRMQDTIGVRIEEIKRLLQTNANDMQLTQVQWENFLRTANVDYEPLQADLEGILADIAAVEQEIIQVKGAILQIQQMGQMMQNPVAAVPCQACQFEGGFDPQCQHCAIATQQAANQNQGQQNMGQLTELQGLLIQLSNELNALKREEQQYLDAMRPMEMDYERKLAIFNQAIQNYQAEANNLKTELAGLERQMSNAPDPDAAAQMAGKDTDDKKQSFIHYVKYPIELRRQELLDWVTRKAELPDLNALPAVGGTPPPLPRSQGERGNLGTPPPLPGGNRPPPLPR